MTLLRIVMLAALAVCLRADDSADELLAAARKGDVSAVKRLLDAGVDVNVKSPYGSTPLFFACDHGHADVVKLLLERGADVNVEDTFYHATALAWAANKKNGEIVKLLLDHGAKSPSNVLMTGVQTGNAEFVKIALDKGGIDKPTLTSALAAAAGKPQIAEMLKAAGAELPATVQLDSATLDRYSGTYVGSASGTEIVFTLAVKDGNLVGAMSGQMLTFSPTDKTHFRCVEVPGANAEFLPGGGFHLTNAGYTVEFKRKEASK